MVAPASRRVARVRRYSGKSAAPGRRFDYAAFTLSGAAFQSASSPASRCTRGSADPHRLSLQPHDRNGRRLATVVVWAVPGSLATTTGMLSLPRGTEMFQFPRCPPHSAVSVRTDGLPHSDIAGSQPARGSPALFAALPRPSSARSAEASSVCSSCLPCWNARRSRRRGARASPDAAPRPAFLLSAACQSALGKVHSPGVHRGQVLHP